MAASAGSKIEVRYLTGLDLGQAQDFTALTIVESREITPEPPRNDVRKRMYPGAAMYAVRHIVRYPLGTDYTAIVADVKATLARAPVGGHYDLLVDAGGPGRPVLDLIRKGGQRPIAISIVGGETLTRLAWDDWHVPKRELCSTVLLLMEQDRLHVAKELAEAPLLSRELASFQQRYTPAANEVFNAREGEHDDILLSLAMALWWGERPRGVFVG